jgi:hypothetical protein
MISQIENYVERNSFRSKIPDYLRMKEIIRMGWFVAVERNLFRSKDGPPHGEQLEGDESRFSI